MLDPISIPHFGDPQPSSDKLGSTKQVLPGEKPPTSRPGNQFNKTHLEQMPDSPQKTRGVGAMLLMRLNYCNVFYI